MAESSKSSHRKRSLDDLDDVDLEPAPLEKKARFPKGRKTKRGDEISELEQDELATSRRAQKAAKERAQRRNQKREQDLLLRDSDPADIFAAEVDYEENTNFVDDGIQIEPFNLKQEREEGYFDANGNFVEYATQNQIKDAWLDNLEVDARFVEKSQAKKMPEEDYQDITSEEIGRIKRNIANVLEPGETIIQALKRLKGTSSDKRGKMSEATKQMFDQLTEDAMKLMENGEYNVYHEERETFEREAEGYERLVRAKEVSSRSSENFDMFGEDDEENDVNAQLDASVVDSGSGSEQLPKLTSENSDPSQELHSGNVEGGNTDYVYDPASGYYYSSSLGYYYDPASCLYCSATTGKWYSFDEQSGEYIEYQSNDVSTETEVAQS
ncbi:CD2 antigen cytoplasmic tail-binding protein 2 [Dioscorea alata]|uniref:CD2 antigen cytoplasmic tail-binding protein 2 n=1 Tax=Dioscorea alata TaxID=55571 RepID=A0ACB7TXK2_DIOAL|nr:CD2 antigen cytoplasmic tail-binding protein 2 [Dioscorea alata]